MPKKTFFFFLVWVGSFLSQAMVCEDYAIPLHNKWVIDKDSWNTFNMDPSQQLSNSIDLIFATLFPDAANLRHFPFEPTSLEKAWQVTQEKSFFLKRLYLVLGLSDLQYTNQDNGIHTCPWPFPLASALTQGQRIMIILRGASRKDFLTFLSGNNNYIYYKRAFSSHAVEWLANTQRFKEVKISSSFRLFKKNQGNLGVNIAFGGIGNCLPNGNLIYMDGQQFDMTKQTLLESHQLGHLLIFWRDFPALHTSVLLIGLEGCAPGTVNIFGCTHTMWSGFSNQKVRRSSTGGAKWARLDLKNVAIPAEYGGKHVEITAADFALMQGKISYFLSLSELQQQHLFKRLPPQDSGRARQLLMTYDQWVVPKPENKRVYDL